MTQHLIQRGQSSLRAGNMTEAVQWFERALENNPKDSQSLACLGQSLCRLGQKKQGIIHLRESGRFIARSAKKSKNINELIAMAEQLQHWGDFEGALELAKQAAQIGKKDVRGFQLLAVTYFRLDKSQQEKGVEIQPDLAEEEQDSSFSLL